MTLVRPGVGCGAGVWFDWAGGGAGRCAGSGVRAGRVSASAPASPRVSGRAGVASLAFGSVFRVERPEFAFEGAPLSETTVNSPGAPDWTGTGGPCCGT